MRWKTLRQGRFSYQLRMCCQDMMSKQHDPEADEEDARAERISFMDQTQAGRFMMQFLKDSWNRNPLLEFIFNEFRYQTSFELSDPNDEWLAEILGYSIEHDDLRIYRLEEQFTIPLAILEKKEPPPPPPVTKPTTWIEIQVVWDGSGEPVAGLQVVTQSIDGRTTMKRTEMDGTIRIEHMEPGACEARCSFQGVTLADCAIFSGTGETSATNNQSSKKESTRLSPQSIVLVDVKKVKTGDTIESIARNAGLKWQDLAFFNWGTKVPEEINKHLAADVGCTKKTADGKNFLFDDSDSPGIVYVPKQWKLAGLGTSQRHVIRVLRMEAHKFDIPPQKASVIEPDPLPSVATLTKNNGEGEEPLLLASADPDFLPVKAERFVRKQHENRGKDFTPKVTMPGGSFIPLQIVEVASRPDIKHDHGFLGDDVIDDSRRRPPTMADRAAFAEWVGILEGAELLRPDLIDGTQAYRHFLFGKGKERTFDYERYVAGDRAGAMTLKSAIDDIRSAAIELDDVRILFSEPFSSSGLQIDSFVIQSGGIAVGSLKKNRNPRYPYPGTENWQKAIGAHTIWLEGEVIVTTDTGANVRQFVIKMTLHAEDRYNFNPNNKDAATGILDAQNGRFEVTGLAQEYMNVATLKRTIKFSVPSEPQRDPRQCPPDQEIES